VRTRLALFTMTAWLAGCSTLAPDAGNQGGSVPAPRNVSFDVRWRESIAGIGFSGWSNSPIVNPGEVRWRMRGDAGDMGTSILRPALLDGSLYVASAEGGLLRLDAATGVRQWRVRTGVTITGGVTAQDGIVVVGGEKGQVLAYDVDGKLRWKAVATSEVLGPATVVDGIVVVRSEDGAIVGLDAKDGKRKWLYQHQLPVLVVRSSAAMALHEGVLYAGFAGGKLVALDPTNGAVRWESVLSEPRGTTELERISDITSTPRVDNQEVCAVSYQGRVGCFGLGDGTLTWSRPYSSDKGLALSDKTLYVSSVSGEILALDKGNGSSVWKNSQLDKLHTSAPTVVGDYLIAGDKNGTIYAIRQNDGSIAARISTDGSPIQRTPLKVDGGVVVQTYNGGLYSIRLRSQD
jgi:outer membrane protein assembly factor BamB